ncbi:MAG: GH25 family lysozyme [Oscillospiraceae bacterium]|nr:GH25 family lysozyme [Oscillospiraceae bacterium]
MRGIDVSVHNGVIDWNAVKAGGTEFAMIKATQGKSIYMKPQMYLFCDSRFKANIAGASAAGIMNGVYHYFTAESVEKAVEEADYFISAIEPFHPQIKLWAAVDVEEESIFKGFERKRLSELILAFCERVCSAGFAPMLYTNRNYMRYRLDMKLLADLDIWQAHWSETKPDDCGEKLKIWQYGFDSVRGIYGRTDVNIGFWVPESFYEEQTARICGFEQCTIDYINKYEYAKELWRKIYNAVGK